MTKQRQCLPGNTGTGELLELLVFQVEIDGTLAANTDQLSVVNRVEVLSLLRVTMDGNNLTAKKSVVAAFQFGYNLALVGYRTPLNHRRFDHLGRNYLEPGGGEFVHVSSRLCPAKPGSLSLFL